jgi:uncharacterized protein (DUF2236 family)
MLMQVAHPLVAAGVAEHSTFRRRRIDRFLRLHATVRSMLALTFGPEAEADHATARINAIHDRVQGVLPEGAGPFAAGTRYSAHDPALLHWVHATLLYAMPRTYELFVGPLSDAEKDRYCAEATSIAPRLGIPDGLLPECTADLERYLAATLASGTLHATAAGRALAHEILDPPVPWPARPLLALTRLPAIGLLPAPLREAFGLRWSAGEARRLRRLAAAVRILVRVAPYVLRYWPAARRAYAEARAAAR